MRMGPLCEGRGVRIRVGNAHSLHVSDVVVCRPNPNANPNANPNSVKLKPKLQTTNLTVTLTLSTNLTLT